MQGDCFEHFHKHSEPVRIDSESTNEKLGRDKKTSKPAKSNSELMAEFFSINSDADKK